MIDSIDLIVVPDRLRVDQLVVLVWSEADFEKWITLGNSSVVHDNLITVHHISKTEGDHGSVLADIHMVMSACVRAPGCSYVDSLTSSSVDFVEACWFPISTFNVKLAFVSIKNVFHDLLALEDVDLIIMNSNFGLKLGDIIK